MVQRFSRSPGSFGNPEVRRLLDKYLRGFAGQDAMTRVKVLKLLWDAIGTEFGGRHELSSGTNAGQLREHALLAYKIGPRNGGLRAIMTQYGARDFVTIQPYLQHLPRDYPIRVLSAALAYRLWRNGGRLPRYEDGDTALHIQSVGIPGLSAAKS